MFDAFCKLFLLALEVFDLVAVLTLFRLLGKETFLAMLDTVRIPLNMVDMVDTLENVMEDESEKN
jgi:hypothetical protein